MSAGWRPIESAPRDGTRILLGDPDGFPGYEGFWMADPSRNHWGETGWFAVDSDILCEHPHSPSCWMPLPVCPLPTPPTGASE